jgi:hypothetical protein
MRGDQHRMACHTDPSGEPCEVGMQSNLDRQATRASMQAIQDALRAIQGIHAGNPRCVASHPGRPCWRYKSTLQTIGIDRADYPCDSVSRSDRSEQQTCPFAAGFDAERVSRALSGSPGKTAQPELLSPVRSPAQLDGVQTRQMTVALAQSASHERLSRG